MAEESLKIRIGADVTDFNKGVAQVEKSLNTLKQPVQGASNVLTNLSRVASDAPFGFIAIQNNLEPLIQSFGSLSQTAGGTGGALKSLALSLAGPAGLAVGFSVVSSLVTSTIQKYGSLSNAISILTAGSSQLAKQTILLNNIRKEAIEDASKEIARLNVLSAVAKDNTNSQKNRIEAANELLKVYKEYLPNLTQEAILNGKAAEAINLAKDAILNRALAAAAENKVVELGQKLLDVRLRQVDAEKRLTNERKNASKGFSTEEFINAEASAIVRAEQNVKNLKGEYSSLQKEYDKLISLTTDFAKKSGDAFIQDKATKSAEDLQKKILEATLLRYKREQEEIKKTSGIYSIYFLEATKNVEKAQANLDIYNALKIKDGEGARKIREYLQNELKRLDAEFKANRIAAGQLEITPIFRLNQEDARARLKELVKKLVAVKDSVFKEALETAPTKITLKPIITLSPEAQKKSEEIIRNLLNFEILKENAIEAAQVLSSVLNPVIDTFFDNLNQGKLTLKSLGESIRSFVINALKQFAKLAAIAAGITLFSGGKIGFGTSLKIASSLGGGFGAGLGGTAPLGAIGGGGFGLNIGGSFNVRGTDLVAVINQANQRIGRVG